MAVVAFRRWPLTTRNMINTRTNMKLTPARTLAITSRGRRTFPMATPSKALGGGDLGIAGAGEHLPATDGTRMALGQVRPGERYLRVVYVPDSEPGAASTSRRASSSAAGCVSPSIVECATRSSCARTAPSMCGWRWPCTLHQSDETPSI